MIAVLPIQPDPGQVPGHPGGNGGCAQDRNRRVGQLVDVAGQYQRARARARQERRHLVAAWPAWAGFDHGADQRQQDQRGDAQHGQQADKDHDKFHTAKVGPRRPTRKPCLCWMAGGCVLLVPAPRPTRKRRRRAGAHFRKWEQQA